MCLKNPKKLTMRHYTLLIITLLVSLTATARRTPKPEEVDSLGRKIKTGWNFGVLPSVAYDADYGFQGGALANIYDYGDGSQYPEYRHSLYVELSYSTKHHGTFRANYDSRYLIPGHLLTIDATYLPDAMCYFLGYNGFQSRYDGERPDSYYKHRRDLIRVAADIEGDIVGNLRWNAGLGVLGYIVRSTNDTSLYQRYVDWGVIGANEQQGGWHPYVRGGISYDSRDRRQGATRGIYTDLFLTYSAAFNAAYGQQASAGYNHLQLNFTFRHYVPVYKDRIVFAYRVGTQNVIAGRSPFYMCTYLNTQAIQRDLYEGLGGGNSLRGVLTNRILADGFAYANLEFRFRLVNFDLWRQHFFIAASPFFDLGVVTQPVRLDLDAVRASVTESGEAWSEYFASDKREIYYPHMAAGVGLKAGMNENFILSLDWGMPVGDRLHRQQDNARWANFYVKMGYLF